jgi:peptide/nickel transport system substrate-binding protein
MNMIESFDPGNKDSPIYDESLALSINATLASFKGYRITSTNPLTIEAYSDSYNADAELNILTLWPQSLYGLQGENSWQILAISNLAEANKELAYTQDKADKLKVENTSWVGGPSLDILTKYLDQAAGESYLGRQHFKRSRHPHEASGTDERRAACRIASESHRRLLPG